MWAWGWSDRGVQEYREPRVPLLQGWEEWGGEIGRRSLVR